MPCCSGTLTDSPSSPLVPLVLLIHLIRVMHSIAVQTGQRIEGVRRETEQLYHAMSGAGIFFKKSDLE